MLFLTEDNDFSGDSQDITIEVCSFRLIRSRPPCRMVWTQRIRLIQICLQFAYRTACC